MIAVIIIISENIFTLSDFIHSANDILLGYYGIRLRIAHELFTYALFDIFIKSIFQIVLSDVFLSPVKIALEECMRSIGKLEFI